MTIRLPVVFVSHGAPDVLLGASDAVACWRQIGQQVPEPRAILAISAHWQTRTPMISLSGAPATLHDFAGFQPDLYQMHYPAPGAPALAERVLSLLRGAGIASDLHPDRGLDHGAWIPLTVMFPKARVPVTQLSITHQDPAAHVALGQALAPLRDEGVLILASGAITHNFGWLEITQGSGALPLPKAQAFTEWVAQQLNIGDVNTLLDYRTAPFGAEAHPSEDHFLPLLVALGAAQGYKPIRQRLDFAYRGLAMDAYVWQK